MTRAEYEQKKLEYKEKIDSINQEYDLFVKTYHTEELNQYKNDYNNKWICVHNRTYNQCGEYDTVPWRFTIYHIKDVTFVTNDGIRATVDEWIINYTDNPLIKNNNEANIELLKYLNQSDEIIDLKSNVIIISEEKAKEYINNAINYVNTNFKVN